MDDETKGHYHTKIGQLRARCSDLGRDKQLLINEVKRLTALVVELGGEPQLEELQGRLSEDESLVSPRVIADLEERLWEEKQRSRALWMELEELKGGEDVGS